MKAFHDFGRDALLLETLSSIAKCQDQHSFWTESMHRLKWLLNFTRVDVALRNPDGTTYNLQTVFELRPDAPFVFQADLALSRGIVGKMMRSGESCHCFNPRTAPFANECIVDERLEGGSLLSILSVSLEAGRQVLGVLSFGSTDDHAYCHQDMLLASRFATHAAIAIQNWQRFAKLKEDAGLLDLAAEKLQDSHALLESLVEERTAALRALSQQLLKSQDQERRRIARELHDSLGQTLSWLKMSAARLHKRFKDDPDSGPVLAEIADTADQALREIRTASYLLHPPLLDELGLDSAVHWYVEGFSQRSAIQVNLDFPSGGGRLPKDVEMVFFRVLQESLTNVHRHSGASIVHIRLERTAEGVQLEVQDDGHGIPPKLLDSVRNAKSYLGVGLAGMRERINDLNGQFEMESSAVGTILRVRVPLAADADPPAPPDKVEVQSRSASAA